MSDKTIVDAETIPLSLPKDHGEVIYLTANELAERIRKRELSSREVVDAHIDRIERVDGAINAVVMRRFDEARREADAADEAIRQGVNVGPLHGVPVTIKDQFLVSGMPMTCGLSRFKDNISDSNGQAVDSWVKAGAIILGKTNVPQTMCALETDNALFGRTNNPWDMERTPGVAVVARRLLWPRAVRPWDSVVTTEAVFEDLRPGVACPR